PYVLHMRRIAARYFDELRSQKHFRSNLLWPPTDGLGISLSLSRALTLRRLKRLDVTLSEEFVLSAVIIPDHLTKPSAKQPPPGKWLYLSTPIRSTHKAYGLKILEEKRGRGANYIERARASSTIFWIMSVYV